MIKKLLFLFFFISSLVHSQTVTISPATFGATDEITVTVSSFDAQAEWGTTDLYLWAWHEDATGTFVANASNTGSDFANSPTTAKFTNQTDGTYTYTFTPSSFYNTTDVVTIGLLVKNQNGSKQTGDYRFDVGGYQLALTNPTTATTIVNAGETVNITAETSLDSDFVLTSGTTTIHSTTTASKNYSYSLTISETTALKLSATNGSTTLTQSFTYAVAPNITEAPVPDGMLDGINLDVNDPTKATLVLYAPGKEFVNVIGDFNNWELQDNYAMNKDSNSDRFWITLSGLSPQTNHMYQYMVEYSIAIADPYSTTILDENNDQFINAITYPNLPSYPEGKTTQAVTLLRTGDSEFTWSDATLNFQKPKKTDLVIYELLLRDFDALHSYDALKARLDYLEDLGINAIELMPISEFDGNESWGYNPSFHMALDKYYGTPEALKQLIDECHSRGIAIILDVVYNHASGQNPYYRLWNTDNGGTGGQAAANNPFFNEEAKHSYSVFNDYNHQSQATQNYVNRTLTYWIEEYKIDGFRWDLTKGFTQNCSDSDQNCTNTAQADRIAVLKTYADTQWESDANFYVIFEHLGGITEEKQWADYRADEGKGIMLWNKQTEAYGEMVMGYHDSNKSNIANAYSQQKGFSNPAAVSYMESHDEERLLFKSNSYGASATAYNVKNTATGLARSAAAGAFFFTIPGPKMIWQFGELGYDISIDFNGRVGNKPIRWNYVDDADRMNIYTTWSELITLKTERVFETSNVDLNVNSSTGVKTIHLTLDDATSNEIKYITVIGNFSTSTKNVNPDFQQTGNWYEPLVGNLKYQVTNTNATITLAPGEFRVFGDKISTLFPNLNIADADEDGVADDVDNCPNTPVGERVDVNGCPIFTLPTNHFTIETASETCRASNNGSLTIVAVGGYTYTATLSGDANATAEFTTQHTFTNLEAGSYTICITLAEQPGYEQCYTITISQPEDLAVSAKVSPTGKVSLDLSGGTLYYISVNGITMETNQSNFEMQLTARNNRIVVKTDADCQGIYEETIIYGSNWMAYPNPTIDHKVTVDFGTTEESNATATLMDINGKVIFTNNYPIQQGKAIVPFANAPRGILLLRVTTPNNTQHFKIIN